MMLLALVCALGLALVHLFAGHLHLGAVVPRSAWLSAAGGASVAYVFLHLLPALAAAESTLSDAIPLGSLERHVWLAALAGLAAFYGLEQVALRNHPEETTAEVFWPHVASFALYNALIGYLLFFRETENAAGLLLFAAAMVLHLAVNDEALRRHHRDQYQHVGRWVLAAAVAVGAGLGALTEPPEAVPAFLLAFLGGAIVLNTLKEELPEEREGRFFPFVLGAVLYSALLLLIEAL